MKVDKNIIKQVSYKIELTSEEMVQLWTILYTATMRFGITDACKFWSQLEAIRPAGGFKYDN